MEQGKKDLQIGGQILNPCSVSFQVKHWSQWKYLEINPLSFARGYYDFYFPVSLLPGDIMYTLSRCFCVASKRFFL